MTDQNNNLLLSPLDFSSSGPSLLSKSSPSQLQQPLLNRSRTQPVLPSEVSFLSSSSQQQQQQQLQQQKLLLNNNNNNSLKRK